MVLVAVLLGTTAASAVVDRVVIVSWQGNPDNTHTAINGQAVEDPYVEDVLRGIHFRDAVKTDRR